MTNEEIIIRQAVELAELKLTEITKEIRVSLKEILIDEAKKLYENSKQTETDIDPILLAERLDGLVTRMNRVFQKKTNQSKTSSQQDMIDWFYIQPNATYYQNRNPHKIVVNVINDDHINSSKSNYKQQLDDKHIYSSSNTIIGSRTMDDLLQVIKNQRSAERVIIIDDYKSDSPTIDTNIPQQQQLPVYYYNMQSFMPNYVYFTTTFVTPYVHFRY